LQLSANVLLLNWTDSFYVNAEIRSFTLSRNDLVEYIDKNAFYYDNIVARNICELPEGFELDLNWPAAQLSITEAVN